MLLLMMMIHISSVLSEETTLTQQVSHTPLKCQSRSGPQRGTKVNGSHRGDNPLLKPTRIHIAEQSLPCPTTREHRELIGVKTMSLCTNGSFYCQECCQCFKNLNDKLKRRLSDPLHIHQTKSSQVIQNVFLAVRGLREDKSMHTLQAMAPTSKNGASNLLTPYREQFRSIRIVDAYPRPVFAATKWTNHAPISFDQQAEFFKAVRHAEIRKN